jgi:hypothetical protein
MMLLLISPQKKTIQVDWHIPGNMRVSFFVFLSVCVFLSLELPCCSPADYSEAFFKKIVGEVKMTRPAVIEWARIAYPLLDLL